MSHDTELRDRLVALTRDLALIPSTDSRPDERARCVQFINNHIESLEGIRIDHHEANGYTSLVAMPEHVTRPDVLMCGHLDVIEHPEPGSYLSTVRDGRIHGPGVGDMKGALAIMLTLFSSLHEKHRGLSLGMAVTSDEERGGYNGVRYLFEDVGLRCGVTIVPDGGSLDELTVEEKGILHLRVACGGHTAHAARPWQGDNAVHKLTSRLVQWQARFAGQYTETPADAADLWLPTSSVTILRTENTTVNRVPDHAEAVLDIRFPPPESVESMMDQLHSVFGEGFAFDVLTAAEPTHFSPDDLFCRVTEEITGRPVTRVRIAGGSDARFIRAYGIPVNLSRPLVGNLHTEDEWIDIDSMVAYYRICETYIRQKVLGIE